jgi:hypothetical protein
MRQTGNNHLIEVGEQAIERLRVLRSRIREHRRDLTGLCRREHRKLVYMLQIVGNPFNDSMAVLPELVR